MTGQLLSVGSASVSRSSRPACTNGARASLPSPSITAPASRGGDNPFPGGGKASLPRQIDAHSQRPTIDSNRCASLSFKRRRRRRKVSITARLTSTSVARPLSFRKRLSKAGGRLDNDSKRLGRAALEATISSHVRSTSAKSSKASGLNEKRMCAHNGRCDCRVRCICVYSLYFSLYVCPLRRTVPCQGVKVLLSFTVFLNLVGDRTPNTSDALPLIGSKNDISLQVFMIDAALYCLFFL